MKPVAPELPRKPDMNDRITALIAMRLAVTLVILTIFTLASIDKLMQGSAPEWFIDQFGDTWMGAMPQTPMFMSIALFELLIAIGALASLVRLEWLRPPGTMLRWTLIATLFLFVGLGFGARVSGQFEDAAFHFLYFCGVLLMFLAIDRDDVARSIPA